jgi:SagB-type dehydrogenase family enzyme
MTSTASQYVEAVVRRAREPMEPAHFEPDWADQPRRYKVYQGVPEWPLPPGTGTGAGPLAGVPAPRPLRLESLAALLRQTFGLLTRRLRITANTRIGDPTWYQDAAWSRGTASGGGLYPLEIYWVCGPSGPLLPGVYYYASPRHTLQRLLAGDVTGQVRDALPGHPDGQAADQFLLVTVKFWKNSFKYNSFCYHVVTMDLGALLASWQLWSAAAGLPGRPALWFDEEALNRLLNLDTAAESTMAVVPLPPGPEPARAPAATAAGHAPGPASPRAAVCRTESERSRVVLRFPQVEAVHAAAVAASPLPPAAGAIDGIRANSGSLAHTAGVALPAPRAAVPGAELGRALSDRRSSFGAFMSRPALGQSDASTLLAAAAAARLSCDAGDAALTRLAVFVNHVAGIPAGAYDYCPGENALTAIPGPPAGLFLQRHYFLDNYNLEQAAMVVAVIARPAAVIGGAGDRGYRLVNAAAGAVAQALYLAAAACGVGCGAVLGFDNVAIAERLGFAATDERALLLIMVGPERPGAADFDFRLA